MGGLDIFLFLRYKASHVAAVAQLVEQRTENPRVKSSILFGGTSPSARKGFFVSSLSLRWGSYLSCPSGIFYEIYLAFSIGFSVFRNVVSPTNPYFSFGLPFLGEIE